MSGHRQLLYGRLLGEELKSNITHKLLCWLHYVNHTFVTWSHEQEKLGRFLDNQNCLHRNIQFTMEMERDSHLPFLTETSTGVRMAPSATRSTENLPTQTSA